MPRSDFARVVLGERAIESWASYEIASSLMTPADRFQFQLVLAHDDRAGDTIRDASAPGTPVKVYVGDDVTGRRRNRYLQHTGLIETQELAADEKGTTITVSGRDLASHLTDSSAPLTLLAESTTFVDVVEQAVEPWGIRVTADSQASRDILTGERSETRLERLMAAEARSAGIPPAMYSRQLRRRAEREGMPIDEAAGVTVSDRSRRRMANGMVDGDVRRIPLTQAKPQPGETMWGFIERHAKRLGLMVWFSPDGRLVLSAPNYGQPPLYRLIRRRKENPDDPNTIASGGVVSSIADRYSAVTVYGRGGGNDATRASVVSMAIDPDVDFHRPLIVRDTSVRTGAEAERRALRELNAYKRNGKVLRYSMWHHGQGRYLYAIDTIAYVLDEVADVEGLYYVTDRTFRKSEGSGTTTELQLVPKGAIEI